MNFKKDKCPKCGKHNIILPTNNPIVPGICNYCISTTLKYNDLIDADFFCRTYNIPLNPEKWIKISKSYKEEVFYEYLMQVNEFMLKNGYTEKNLDLWVRANEEWAKIQTHEELLSKMEPLREGFIERNKIKWGPGYTFNELINLESLFIHTLKANNVSNPIQIDAVKKACKMSIAIDQSITSRESKEINDLTRAYQGFVKIAKIDDLITASSEDVISNVSELVDYIERSGFKFKYYDNVERDIVDKSIDDIKLYIRRLVQDSTGLEVALERVSQTYREDKAKEEHEEAVNEVSLESLFENSIDIRNSEIDKELEEDEMEDFFDMGDEEDEFFG